MAGNTFGTQFRITTFGESHGAAVGVVIDGCPAGLSISLDDIQADLARRATGQSSVTSERKEPDMVEILSGVENDVTLGTPIAMMVKNKDARKEDYKDIRAFRPSHADFTYQQKYGIRASSGGGRSSARETTARVMAGTIAKTILHNAGIDICAFVSRVKDIDSKVDVHVVSQKDVEQNIMRCPDENAAKKMQKLVEAMKEEGDSVGGVLTCVVRGVPPGLGEPVFDKLEADLAKAMLSLPATKGFEIGSGFAGTAMTGSEHNDPFVQKKGGSIGTTTNNSGGIQGGISNGEPIVFRTAFKPVSTIKKKQQTVNEKGEAVELENIKGRHDPCVLPRAVPMVEAMAALVLVDHYLRHKTSTL